MSWLFNAALTSVQVINCNLHYVYNMNEYVLLIHGQFHDNFSTTDYTFRMGMVLNNHFNGRVKKIIKT
jgi:hypothetical protein